MAIDFSDLLRHAEAMANLTKQERISPSDQEVFARESVRLAYYACFHRALEFASYRGFSSPRGRSVHEALWDCWYNTDAATRDIATDGKSLREYRVDADYIICEPLPLQVDEVLEQAKELLEEIQKHESEVLKHPKKRIRKWDKSIYEFGNLNATWSCEVPTGATAVSIRKTKETLFFEFDVLGKTQRFDIRPDAEKE